MFLQQSVNDGGLPFQPKVKQPNIETLKAMAELAEGKGQTEKNTEDLYKALNI